MKSSIKSVHLGKSIVFNIFFLGFLICAGVEAISLKWQPRLEAEGSQSRAKVLYSDILGAGASLPFPLYAKMFEEYLKEKAVPVNYQSIGSGGGIRQIEARTVDFGATDSALDDRAVAKFKREKKEILHVPIVMGAVSVIYNLPSISKLRLDGQALAGIYSGKIKKWNNAAIQKQNPGIRLPNKSIIVVHRSDGSGTTFVFSDFLAYSSASWKKEIGIGKSLRWFRGALGAKGNEGLTQQVKNIPGSIGYVSLNYALQARLPIIAVKNADNNYITPSTESVSLAVPGNFPNDARVELSGHPTKGKGYPISTLTWILVYKNQSYQKRTKAQAKELKDLLNWMISDGQKYAESLFYAPLPKIARQKAGAILKEMRYNKSEI